MTFVEQGIPLDIRSVAVSTESHIYINTISILTGIFLISPLSNYLFTTSFGFLAEIPIVAIAALASLWRFSINKALLHGIVKGAFIAFVILAPFVLFAMVEGVVFDAYYPDFRAMFLLIVMSFGLRSLQLNTALRFAYYSSSAAMVATGILFILTLFGGMHGFEATDFSGKYFPPIFPELVLALFFAHRRATILPILGILILLAMATTTSYRQVPLIAAVISMGIGHALLIRLTTKGETTINIATVLAVGLSVTYILTIPLEYMLTNLQILGDVMVQLGFDSSTVEQLVFKTVRTMHGEVADRGDGMYFIYLQNLFNFVHFILPHGLGQAASYGSPDIWGGNTVDNSIIFLNYHFSIVFTIPVLFYFLKWNIRSLRGVPAATLISILPIQVGFLIFLYFRAGGFISIDGAIGLAFMLYSAPVLTKGSRV